MTGLKDLHDVAAMEAALIYRQDPRARHLSMSSSWLPGDHQDPAMHMRTAGLPGKKHLMAMLQAQQMGTFRITALSAAWSGRPAM